jgi:SAM-dependent methyltransferase
VPAKGDATSSAGSGREAGATAAQGQLLDEVASYYAARYRAFGDCARGMDWKDESSQRLRFEVLTRHLDLRGEPSLIDVGCGNGELLAFLQERGIAVRYLGIDVCPDMVAACQRRFGADSAALASTSDLAARGWAADHVVASGNVKQAITDSVWHDYMQLAVREMYEACRLATAFNVMSARVDRRYDHLYYLDAARAPELADLCRTRRFLLDHSYPLFELTVALLR